MHDARIQQDIAHTWNAMAGLPGWAVLEADGLFACKGPVLQPIVNFAWGEPTRDNVEKAKAFFGRHSFNWFTCPGPGEAQLAQEGFAVSDTFPELVLDLSGAPGPDPLPEIEVVVPRSARAEIQWVEVLAENFGLGFQDAAQSFLPLVHGAGSTLFLARWKGEPVATAMLSLGGRSAGIYAVSTRERFRRAGFGQAVMNACLETARQRGQAYATLYPSTMGRPWYEKMGFRPVRFLTEFVFKPRSLEE